MRGRPDFQGKVAWWLWLGSRVNIKSRVEPLHPQQQPENHLASHHKGEIFKYFGNVELGFYANFSLYAQLFQDDSTEKLFQLEPNAPSTLVTCIFASCYFSLGNQFYRDESIKGYSIIQSLNGKILQLNSNYRNRKKNFSCCNALKFCILFSSTFRRQKGFFNLSFTSSDSE